MMLFLHVALLVAAAGSPSSDVEDAVPDPEDGNLRGSPRVLATNTGEEDSDFGDSPASDEGREDAQQDDLAPQQVGQSFGPSKPLVASTICVQNSGGFFLRFMLWNTDNNTLSVKSPGGAFGSQQCINISSLTFLSLFDAISTVVDPTGGFTQSFQTVLYKPGSGTVLFVCTGGTGNLECAISTQGPAFLAPGVQLPTAPVPLPAVQAGAICVTNSAGFRMRFRMWDTVNNVFSLYSARFNTPTPNGPVCLFGTSIVALAPGNPLVLVTEPVGGLRRSFRSVIYKPGAPTANFTCTGGTFSYNCILPPLTH